MFVIFGVYLVGVITYLQKRREPVPERMLGALLEALEWPWKAAEMAAEYMNNRDEQQANGRAATQAE